MRDYVTFLLEAADADTAMKDGRELADENAPPQAEWKCFTAMSAASVTLPLQLPYNP